MSFPTDLLDDQLFDNINAVIIGRLTSVKTEITKDIMKHARMTC